MHSLGIFICVPLVLLVVVLAAIYVPASRAVRVDPMELSATSKVAVLRTETSGLPRAGQARQLPHANSR